MLGRGEASDATFLLDAATATTATTTTAATVAVHDHVEKCRLLGLVLVVIRGRLLKRQMLMMAVVMMMVVVVMVSVLREQVERVEHLLSISISLSLSRISCVCAYGLIGSAVRWLWCIGVDVLMDKCECWTDPK